MCVGIGAVHNRIACKWWKGSLHARSALPVARLAARSVHLRAQRRIIESRHVLAAEPGLHPERRPRVEPPSPLLERSPLQVPDSARRSASWQTLRALGSTRCRTTLPRRR